MRSAGVAVPFLVVGLAGAGYGGAAMYTGYASKDWPHCKAVATNFQVLPTHSVTSFLMGGDTNAYVIGTDAFLAQLSPTNMHIRFRVLHSRYSNKSSKYVHRHFTKGPKFPCSIIAILSAMQSASGTANQIL